MNKYCVKHKRQTLSDFTKDCHRFSFWYNGKEKEVSCYGAVSIFFDDESVPDDVKYEISVMVYKLIDKNESKWSVPRGAQEIADAYCEKNFN